MEKDNKNDFTYLFKNLKSLQEKNTKDLSFIFEKQSNKKKLKIHHFSLILLTFYIVMDTFTMCRKVITMSNIITFFFDEISKNPENRF